MNVSLPQEEVVMYMAVKRTKKKRLDLRIWEKDKLAFQKQAEMEGRSLSGWIIQTCKERVPGLNPGKTIFIGSGKGKVFSP